MADERTEWEFDLKDSFSSPARHMESALGSFKEKMKESIHVFHDVVESAFYVGEALHKAFEFGEMILEQREWKENTLIALRAITGSSEEARRIFEQSREFAIESGQAVRSVVDESKQLRQAGFAAKDIQVLNVALSDLRSTHGDEAANLVRQSLVGVANQGRLTERAMLGLKGVAGLESAAMGFLGSKLHVTGDQLKKMISAGTVPKDWGVLAIVEGIRKLGGGTLGAVTKEVAESPLKLIQSIKGELAALLDFEPRGAGPGMIQQALMDVRDLLRPGSPFVAGVRAGVDSLLEGFGLGKGGTAVHDFLEGLKSGTAVGGAFRDAMRDVGRDLRIVLGLLSDTGKVLTKVFEGWNLLVHGVDWGYLREQVFGKSAGATQSTAAQISSAVPNSRKSMQELAGGDSLKAAAWWMFGVPDAVKNGGTVPAMARGGVVDKPTLALIGEAGPEAVTPLPRAGSPRAGGRSVTINLGGVHVSATDANPAQVSSLVQMVRDATLEALTGAAEELAMEAGGA